MEANSHASKRLSALYRALLRRWRRSCSAWARVEALEPRLLMSVAPVGAEIQIDQSIGAAQAPAIASNAAGDFVAVWQSQNPGGSGSTVFARRFDSSGDALGDALQVNQTSQGDQTRPAVAMDSAGDFVVTWVSGQGVDARVFNADGSARGGEQIAIAAQPTGTDTPGVAMNADGGFAVVCDQPGGGILLQQFSAAGAAVGPVVQVNTTTYPNQFDPSIAMDASGDFVVVWTDQSSGAGKIQGQRFAASGVMEGGQFLVGTMGANSESNAKVAMDDAGDFVVAWQDVFSDGSFGDIYARRYNAAGAALDGAPVCVNTYTAQVQQSPAVAELPDGRYFITWQSQGEDGDGWGIFGQAFNANGTPDGGEFQINATTQEDQQDPAVAWSGTNVFVVWDGQGAGAGQGIFGRQLVSDAENNQPPTLVAPPAQTTADGTPLIFSASQGDAISMADPDAGGGVEQLTLTATHGLLTLADTAGLSFISGDGVGDSSMTFVATLTSINAALASVTFTPAENFQGSASIVLIADDLGNTGAGGAMSTTAAVGIDVTSGPATVPASGSAHTPAVTSAATTENEPTDSGLVITPAGADVSIDGFFQITAIDEGALFQSDGVTQIHDGDFIAFAHGESGLIFSPAPNSAGEGGFSVQASTTASPGGLGGAIVSATVVIHAPPDISTTTGSIAYVEGQAPANIDSTIGLSDPDSGTLAGAQVTILGYMAGQDVLSFTNPSGITGAWNAQSGVLILSGVASVASYQAALRSITFVNTSADPATSLRVAQFTVNDGVAWSAPTNVPIQLTAINTPPTLTLPAAATLAGDGPLIFSPANGIAIVVGDVDANGGVEQVTLSVTAGTLTVSSRSGLTSIVGAHSSVLTLQGGIGVLDAALATLKWTPAAHDAGPDVLSVTADDLGQSGAGGALTAGGQVFLTIVPKTPPNIGGNNPGGTSQSGGGSSGTSGSTGSGSTGGGGTTGATPPGNLATAAATLAGAESATQSPTIATSDHQGPLNSVALGRAPETDAFADDSVAQAPVDQAVLAPEAHHGIVRSTAVARPSVFSRISIQWDRAALENNLWRDQRSDQALSQPIWQAADVDLSGRSLAARGGARFAASDANPAANIGLIIALDRVRRRLTSDVPLRVWAGVASVVTAGLSVAYFLWLARAGSLLSSLLSSLPAWKLVDPLPILDHAAKAATVKRADDDGLEQLIQDAGGQ